MITVLWVVTVAGVMAAAAALTGRNAVNATRNRVQLERAYWIAAGCGARVQSAIDAVLRTSQTYEDAADTWRILNRAVGPLALSTPGDCTVGLEAAGTRLDINAASVEMLVRLFGAMGYGETTAASLADALEDWRDMDDVALPDGAERDWYARAQRNVPRNGPLADIRELVRVRGFENATAFDSLLSTEPGRVCLATASVTVLLAVPGFTLETAERIASSSAAGTPVRDVMSLAGRVSSPSAEALFARYADVVRMTTTDPDAWILTVRAGDGFPESTVILTRRLVRAGKRAVVVGMRSTT